MSSFKIRERIVTREKLKKKQFYQLNLHTYSRNFLFIFDIFKFCEIKFSNKQLVNLGHIKSHEIFLQTL